MFLTDLVSEFTQEFYIINCVILKVIIVKLRLSGLIVGIVTCVNENTVHQDF